MPMMKDKEADGALKEKDRVQKWMGELSKALKREKSYRKVGKEAEEIYESEKAEEDSFNILYSNTETLSPALYNSTPRPLVERRYKDEDAMGKSASLVAQRVLEFEIDSDFRDYASFDELMQAAVLSALVPGRGVVRFKYEAELAVGAVKAEYVCGEEVSWNNFLCGYAKKWENVPWVAYEHFMSREELEANFGKEVAAKVELVAVSDSDDESKEGKADNESKGVELGHVWEVWDKMTKAVLFMSPGYEPGMLKEVPDPFGLTGFFPQPRPLQFFRRLRSLTPVPLYTFYRTQAKELNRISMRINLIVAALKVRGFYDSTVDGLDKVLEAADNTMVPVSNVAAMQQGQTLDKAVTFMPIEKLVAVLQQLYTQRTQVKQVIYEITGIADIMRGSTSASETLGAQQIKNQWGTLRLKRAQKEVARFVRDSLRIMVELSVTKLSEATIKAMTNVPYPTVEEKQQATLILQQIQSQPQQVGPDGQPQPPQEPPQEVLIAAQSPALGELLKLLQDDTQRSYRVDIETNSTVDAEATEDKQDIAELMNAIAQFLNGAAPAVEKGLLPFEAAKAILLGIVRRYRFGSDVEDLLKNMQAPKPAEPPKPAGEPPEVTQAKTQSALAIEKSKQDTMQLEANLAQQDYQLREREMQLKLAALNRKAQIDEAQHAMRMELALTPKPAPTPAAKKGA